MGKKYQEERKPTWKFKEYRNERPHTHPLHVLLVAISSAVISNV